MHFPHTGIKFSHVIMKIYLPDGAFRSWNAQNRIFFYHEGEHEADSNFIAGKNLNHFL